MGFFQKLLGGNKGGGKMGDLLETITADLNLDQDQVAKTKEAFQAFRQQRKSVKDAGGDKAQIQQARAQMTQQMMSVMSEEQKKIFTANAAKYDGILRGGE